ncbi:hypothetical protein [Acrocarpospora sp. B8E8]|uniref:hypothetical protein n=1 Tax=Acrocarpospora sp. B8E8 TaxID=3153572 RepID=UPI00325D61FA
MTERKLTDGWANAPDVRVRQATPADLPAVAELAPLAGAGLDPRGFFTQSPRVLRRLLPS